MAAAAESTLPLDALYKQMERLLAKQKAVSDELHHMLTDKSTGLCENTRLTLKNLDAAIVTAQQPGYFQYHKAPAQVKQVESQGLVAVKVKEIAQIEKEIQVLKQKIQHHEDQARLARQRREPTISSFKQWFSEYQRPDPAFGGSGFRTDFSKSSKVYGGSKHYPAFKSHATTMKPGSMTK